MVDKNKIQLNFSWTLVGARPGACQNNGHSKCYHIAIRPETYTLCRFDPETVINDVSGRSMNVWMNKHRSSITQILSAVRNPTLRKYRVLGKLWKKPKSKAHLP